MSIPVTAVLKQLRKENNSRWGTRMHCQGKGFGKTLGTNIWKILCRGYITDEPILNRPLQINKATPCPANHGSALTWCSISLWQWEHLAKVLSLVCLLICNSLPETTENWGKDRVKRIPLAFGNEFTFYLKNIIKRRCRLKRSSRWRPLHTFAATMGRDCKQIPDRFWVKEII